MSKAIVVKKDPIYALSDWKNKRLRVAVYARVNTISMEQESDFSQQSEHYRKIATNHPERSAEEKVVSG